MVRIRYSCTTGVHGSQSLYQQMISESTIYTTKYSTYFNPVPVLSSERVNVSSTVFSNSLCCLPFDVKTSPKANSGQIWIVRVIKKRTSKRRFWVIWMEPLGSVMSPHQKFTNILSWRQFASKWDFADTYKTNIATHGLGDFEFYVGGFLQSNIQAEN